MPDHPSAVTGVARRPFREQVAFFRGKLGRLVPTERWDDIQREEHDTAFMVAGAHKADLLADLAASVDRAITEGKSLDAFRKDFDAAVERHDWHGWTGEGTKGGRAWRTRTIYRANATVSYAAGRYAQLKASGFPLWVYRHGGSKHPRPEHLSWNGLVLASDDPAWSWLYPPSDWGCSCYVNGARSDRGARRLGGDPDKQRPAGFGEIDPATDAPAGVGKGWDYAPGARVAETVNAIVKKSGGWHYDLAKAFMESVPDEIRDQLARAYRDLPSVADDARLYAARVLDDPAASQADQRRTLGPIVSADAAKIGPMFGRDVSKMDWSISPSSVGHVARKHGDAASQVPQGQRPVTAEDYAQLPAIIAGYDQLTRLPDSRSGEQQIELVKTIGGERFHAVFALLGGRRTLVLKTLFVRRGR